MMAKAFIHILDQVFSFMPAQPYSPRLWAFKGVFGRPVIKVAVKVKEQNYLFFDS